LSIAIELGLSEARINWEGYARCNVRDKEALATQTS